MSEWMKSTVADLIAAYKKEQNLYDSKHTLYYNKQARIISLNRILEACLDSRPETTPNEITKKIQTLRTQFGQEVSKIEKTQSLGDELTYKPKIWWYSHLQWIADHMKTRSDPTPLSARTKPKQEVATEEPLFEFADEIDDETDKYSTEIELSEMEHEPPIKKPRTYVPVIRKTIRPSQFKHEVSPTVRTIEYTLINEDPNEEIETTELVKNSPKCENQDEEINIKKYKRRSKAFGKYISALLVDIVDDKIFFELQNSITKSIHEACVNQSEERKS